MYSFAHSHAVYNVVFLFRVIFRAHEVGCSQSHLFGKKKNVGPFPVKSNEHFCWPKHFSYNLIRYITVLWWLLVCASAGSSLSKYLFAHHNDERFSCISRSTHKNCDTKCTSFITSFIFQKGEYDTEKRRISVDSVCRWSHVISIAFDSERKNKTDKISVHKIVILPH